MLVHSIFSVLLPLIVMLAICVVVIVIETLIGIVNVSICIEIDVVDVQVLLEDLLDVRVVTSLA